MTFLRFLMILALVVWIGALIFFPVLAYTAFSVLPSQHLAGLIVRNSLVTLDRMGMISGLVFLAGSLACSRMMEGNFRLFRPSHIVIVVMLALTAIVQFKVIPRMDALRLAAGEIASLPANDMVRLQFDSLHLWSTRLEETVLVLGLIVLYSSTRRFVSSRT